MLIDEKLIGKRVNIRMNNDISLYHETLEMVIVDISGQPLAVRLEDGGILNWKHILTILPSRV